MYSVEEPEAKLRHGRIYSGSKNVLGIPHCLIIRRSAMTAEMVELNKADVGSLALSRHIFLL